MQIGPAVLDLKTKVLCNVLCKELVREMNASPYNLSDDKSQLVTAVENLLSMGILLYYCSPSISMEILAVPIIRVNVEIGRDHCLHQIKKYISFKTRLIDLPTPIACMPPRISAVIKCTSENLTQIPSQLVQDLPLPPPHPEL